MVTAASDLARNALVHGGGGRVHVGIACDWSWAKVVLRFEDEGPGIPDVEAALRNGFSTGEGLGLGLGGARWLVKEFDLRSAPGEGTTVTVASWMRRR